MSRSESRGCLLGRLPSWAITGVTVLVLVAIWQLIVMSGSVSVHFIPSPVAVWHAFIRVTFLEGYSGHRLLYHLGSSMLRMLTGFVMACLLKDANRQF